MIAVERPRTDFGKRGAWASISLNALLFILKIILGIFTGSLALVADAFHTLSDLATSLIVLFSFYITAKPSDREHPFGHGRAEFISAVIMSTLLVITAFELLKSSIDRILHPAAFYASWWVIGVIFLTVLLKEALAGYTFYLSRRIKSDVLWADAWHHRLDAISTLLVIVAFIFSYFNFPYLDGPAGVLISLIIAYSAYKIIRHPIDSLLGTPPADELLNRIESITLAFPEVRGVHDVIIHNYGERMVISLHIEMDENLSFMEAHRVAESVDMKLRQELGAHITVHLDPVMKRTPLYQRIENKIRDYCRDSAECDSFHDLRIYGEGKKLKLIFDLVGSPNSPQDASQDLIENCTRFLKQEFPEIEKISIKVEPPFSISRRSRHHHHEE